MDRQRIFIEIWAIAETLTICKYVYIVCILLKWPILYFLPHYTCIVYVARMDLKLLYYTGYYAKLK